MDEVTRRGDEHLTDEQRAAAREWARNTPLSYQDAVDAMTDVMRPPLDEWLKRLADERQFRLWHAHANRARDLHRAGLICKKRMIVHVEMARERMKSLPEPAFFWLTEDDALQPE